MSFSSEKYAVYAAGCKIKVFIHPLRSSVHTLVRFGRKPDTMLFMFVSPEFDFAERLAFQTACRFGKQNQTKQETNLYKPSSVCVFTN